MHFSQIIWLCRELVKMNAQGADSVCLGILRQIVGKFFSSIGLLLDNCLKEKLKKVSSFLLRLTFLEMPKSARNCPLYLKNLSFLINEKCSNLL